MQLQRIHGHPEKKHYVFQQIDIYQICVIKTKDNKNHGWDTRYWLGVHQISVEACHILKVLRRRVRSRI